MRSSSLLPQTVPLYPAELPPSVVSPLLTDGALQLLNMSTSDEEKQLWASLGDSWNISRYHSTGYTGTEGKLIGCSGTCINRLVMMRWRGEMTDFSGTEGTNRLVLLGQIGEMDITI